AAVAASFTAGAMLLTGCAAQDKPAPSVDGVSIELWIGDRITQAGMDATREIVADWEAETGNTVEIVDNSFFELMNKIPVAVPAGEGPDAFLLTNNYVGQFVSQNLIAPVAISD